MSKEYDSVDEYWDSMGDLEELAGKLRAKCGFDIWGDPFERSIIVNYYGKKHYFFQSRYELMDFIYKNCDLEGFFSDVIWDDYHDVAYSSAEFIIDCMCSKYHGEYGDKELTEVAKKFYNWCGLQIEEITT